VVLCFVVSGLTALVVSAASGLAQEPAAPQEPAAAAAAADTAVSTPALVPAEGAGSSSPAAISAAPAAKAAGSAGKAQPDPPGWVQFLPLAFIGIMFYLILLRPQQREQRRRQDTLSSLKKSDKVVTTGGIVGTIADLSQDGRFVTLKVDDSTRVRFLRSAIHGLLEEKSEGSGN
jgi:preprotein translocase subunit YajC